jgi:hypothetical protein
MAAAGVYSNHNWRLYWQNAGQPAAFAAIANRLQLTWRWRVTLARSSLYQVQLID